jgi:hypothetical protein
LQYLICAVIHEDVCSNDGKVAKNVGFREMRFLGSHHVSYARDSRRYASDILQNPPNFETIIFIYRLPKGTKDVKDVLRETG